MKNAEMVYSACIQVLLIIAIKTLAQIMSCDPGEEFKPHNLTCNFTDSNLDYIWYKQKDNIVLCRPYNGCFVEKKYAEIYTASTLNQTLVLNIVNVTRESAGTYSCHDIYTTPPGNNSMSSCDFRVYARAKSIFCQQPELQADNIKIVCTVEKIYPSPVCQFSRFRNDTEMSVPQTIIYQNLSVQGQLDYFYMNCSLTLSEQDLGLGSHEFKFTAYPNVTGNTSDVEYGKSSNKTCPVIINYPTVKLESCPDSYVQEGTNISCTCRETSNTFLPANTSFTVGSTTLSSGAGYITYNFTVVRNMGEFTCQAKLLNWTSAPIKYIPQVAYGPDNVSLNVMYNITDTGSIDLCDRKQPVVFIANCSVSEYGFSPGVVVQFFINGTLMSENPSSSSTLTYNVKDAGPLLIHCTGNNSQFRKMSATSQVVNIKITEPPSGPPIIDINLEMRERTSDILTVQEGINRIRCRVEGGYPSVSNLSLECGNQKNTSEGNMVSLEVNVTRQMDSSECSCTAAHSSSCYWNNKSVYKLVVSGDAISTPGTSPLVTTPHPSSSSVRTESTEVVPPTPSFFRHDFECHQTFMRVYIQNSLVPNAELTMKDPGCRLQDNGTHYVISFLYDMCGTSLTSYTDHVNVQNQITVHTILSNVSGVEFVPDYIIPLQCSVNRTRSIHSAFQVVTRDPMDEHDRMASDFDIKEYRSELYQDEITEYPVLIPFNREIFFDLVLSNNQTNSGISVTKCEATPSSNPNDATRLTLITNGCSASPAVKVQGRYRIDHFRFSVQAFHFSGSINQNNTVYVHCNVSICQPGTCTTVCSRNIRRRRSSRHDVTLTSGTHIVASEVN